MSTNTRTRADLVEPARVKLPLLDPQVARELALRDPQVPREFGIVARDRLKPVYGPNQHQQTGCAILPEEVAERRHLPTEEERVILATSRIEDFDRFWDAFSTKGAEKRKQHGSKGAHVFRDPNENDRVWVVFDWDEEGWQNFISDPDVPAIFQEGGLQGRPQAAELAREHDA
jgi:hypothetical protein